jgi:hypothetical protein
MTTTVMAAVVQQCLAATTMTKTIMTSVVGIIMTTIFARPTYTIGIPIVAAKTKRKHMMTEFMDGQR